jgi:hypothetical protein
VRSLPRTTAGLFVAGAVLLSAGCGTDDACTPEIDPAGRYRLDVRELYTAQSTFTYDAGLTRSTGTVPACSPGFDGIVAGARLELQATAMVPDPMGTCSLVTADLVAAPPEITAFDKSLATQAVAAARSGESLMYAVEDVTLSACTGAIALVVLPGHAAGGTFAAPAPGQPPPVVLYRYFTPQTGSCAACDDNFVVQLTKE